MLFCYELDVWWNWSGKGRKGKVNKQMYFRTWKEEIVYYNLRVVISIIPNRPVGRMHLPERNSRVVVNACSTVWSLRRSLGFQPGPPPHGCFSNPDPPKWSVLTTFPAPIEKYPLNPTKWHMCIRIVSCRFKRNYSPNAEYFSYSQSDKVSSGSSFEVLLELKLVVLDEALIFFIPCSL